MRHGTLIHDKSYFWNMFLLVNTPLERWFSTSLMSQCWALTWFGLRCRTSPPGGSHHFSKGLLIPAGAFLPQLALWITIACLWEADFLSLGYQFCNVPLQGGHRVQLTSCSLVCSVIFFFCKHLVFYKNPFTLAPDIRVCSYIWLLLSMEYLRMKLQRLAFTSLRKSPFSSLLIFFLNHERVLDLVKCFLCIY